MGCGPSNVRVVPVEQPERPPAVHAISLPHSATQDAAAPHEVRTAGGHSRSASSHRSMPQLICPIAPHEKRIAAALQRLITSSDASAHSPRSRGHSRTQSSASLTPHARARDALYSVLSGPACTIPHAHRWWVWQHLSGGAEIASRFPSLYRDMLALGHAPTHVATVIRHDVHRTLPMVPLLGSRAHAGPGQSQLYRILTAYAHVDPGVGYTQGMNFLVAVLLCAGLSEHAAFYAFVGLMTRLGLRFMYTPSLPSVMHTHALIDAALERRHPRLARHLRDVGVLPVLYATPWCMSMCVSSPLPLGSVLVLWDRVLVEARMGAMPALVEAAAVRAAVDAAAVPYPVRENGEAAHAAEQAAPPQCAVAGSASPQRKRRRSSWQRLSGQSLAVISSADVATPTACPAALLVPPALIRTCVYMVVAHASALLRVNDFDSACIIIKDEYDDLPPAVVLPKSLAGSLPPSPNSISPSHSRWSWMRSPLKPLQHIPVPPMLHRLPSASMLLHVATRRSVDESPRFDLAPEHSLAEYGAAVSMRTLGDLSTLGQLPGEHAQDSTVLRTPPRKPAHLNFETPDGTDHKPAAPPHRTSIPEGAVYSVWPHLGERPPRLRGVFIPSVGIPMADVLRQRDADAAVAAALEAAEPNGAMHRVQSSSAALDTLGAEAAVPESLASVPPSPSTNGNAPAEDASSPQARDTGVVVIESKHVARTAPYVCDEKACGAWSLPHELLLSISTRSAWIELQEMVEWERSRE